MKKKMSLIILLVVISLSLGLYLLPKNNAKTKLSLENNYMLSFTVDGVESKTMPTKGSGYITSKITCTNGSIITFDNDNYTIEVEKLDNEDVCKIDFSKEEGNNTVTVTISDTSKIDSTSKTTTEKGKVVFYLTEEPDSITGGEYTLTGKKLIVSDVTSNIILNITMVKSLYDKLLADNPTRLERTSYYSLFTTTNVNTLYKTQESNTDIYYFAGNAQNNWLKFGYHLDNYSTYIGHFFKDSTVTKSFETLSECESDKSYNNNCTEVVHYKTGDPIYWRIIRTNSDESIRLLYHGTSQNSKMAYLKSSYFNYGYNGSTGSGYMRSFGTSINSADSSIKIAIDTWYENNLKTDYGKYLSTTAIYCNDRTPSTASSNYAALANRINTTFTPTLNCSDANDKFTVDSSTGNGKLTYPIGLMTADEILFAGGRYEQSPASPYTWFSINSDGEYSSSDWWLMSPFYYPDDEMPTMCYVDGNGTLGSVKTSLTSKVRPVISLKSCVKYSSGDGSSGSPYTILETESGC